jgi:dimeric dUTPase (all-alpha-NTP-PPase superfamily)
MVLFTSAKEYAHFFNEVIIESGKNTGKVKAYCNELFERLDKLTECISKDNFWEVFPEIIGIDAKLNLIVEMIKYEEFSNDDILRIVESDYRTYLKELCGFNFETPAKHSLVFNVI